MLSNYQTPDALRHDTETLGDDVRDLITATKDVADDKVTAARKRLESSLECAKESLHRADGVIRTHPYESIVAALVFGTCLGALLSRGR